MTSQPLPERANLEQLKKQAKSLLHAAQSLDPDALRRFQPVPSLARLSPAELALHDAQFVIAREYGFKSWNELREHVQDRALSFAEAADEFVRCATGGARPRALRLLERQPAVAHASLYAELVLGDSISAIARLRKNPGAANQPGGIQNWERISATSAAMTAAPAAMSARMRESAVCPFRATGAALGLTGIASIIGESTGSCMAATLAGY